MNESINENKNQPSIRLERYEMLELLGEGGTGKVYLARDTRLGRLTAVKILEQVTKQFHEEVQVLQKRGLSMLPVIYDAWTEEGDCTGVIVMEYVEGQTMREYLSLHRQISEKQIYRWGLQLGEFLQGLHTSNPKVLYRDLKPENIMVQPDGSLRLIDVGAAVCVREGKQWRDKRNKRVGTFGYASPEQWAGDAVDERTDIYSLGALLWVISVNGRKGDLPVFDRKQMEILNGDVGNNGIPAGMALVIRRCLEKDREKRYATAKAFLDAWKRYQWTGMRDIFGNMLLKMGKYSLLLAAAYAVWFAPERFWAFWYCTAGYLVLKLLERAAKKKRTGWEQKKSVWCRG